MTIKLEENIHHIYDWHRVDECMPLLTVILADIDAEIDKKMIDLDPMDPDYAMSAAASWIERRAVDKIRKALTKIIKKGRVASKTIAPRM